ncbi:hypothetical protein HDE68_002644 [Pedobacter cryoconitis]|uniref:Uncharacterized protein n=1 Tax=Pedobacter cryoconitis TaxID=188932 RepID=A0A7W9DZ64_9SPHI|nr:hypothetical protein [Pedobacter cryoconitis]MBB5636743.1 hypothetical protein [Pedobacter cryoconitis]
MSLDQQRLKQKIKTAIQAEQAEEQNANTSLDRLSEAISQAVIAEIKALKINYTSGLVSPNGPVTGTLNMTIE